MKVNAGLACAQFIAKRYSMPWSRPAARMGGLVRRSIQAI